MYVCMEVTKLLFIPHVPSCCIQMYVCMHVCVIPGVPYCIQNTYTYKWKIHEDLYDVSRVKSGPCLLSLSLSLFHTHTHKQDAICAYTHTYACAYKCTMSWTGVYHLPCLHTRTHTQARCHSHIYTYIRMRIHMNNTWASVWAEQGAINAIFAHRRSSMCTTFFEGTFSQPLLHPILKLLTFHIHVYI